MDPITAALELANTIARIVEKVIDALPAEEKTAFAKIQLDNLKRWQDIVDKLAIKLPKGGEFAVNTTDLEQIDR
jgi:hypothetical protein